MLRFGKTKVAKEKFIVEKITKNIWDVNVGNLVISKLVETNTNLKYSVGYFDKVITPLVLVISKMNGYIRYLNLKIKSIN